jgi:hypothetical protein
MGECQCFAGSSCPNIGDFELNDSIQTTHEFIVINSSPRVWATAFSTWNNPLSPLLIKGVVELHVSHTGISILAGRQAGRPKFFVQYPCSLLS